MAWLSTVSPVGRPDTVAVWYLLRDDDTVLLHAGPRIADVLFGGQLGS